jgi:hypothetical protein
MAQPVALNIQTPDSFKTIGNMLNFATQAQNLQRGNIDLQQNQIKLQERQGIQKLFQSPDLFKGEDGQPDYNKLINEGMKVAPTTFPTMVPQIIQAHQSSIEAQKSLNTLNNQQRDAVGQFIFSLQGDDPQTARKKLDGLVNVNPQLKPAVDFAWNYNLAPNAGNPESWKKAVMGVGRAAMTLPEQRTAMTPQGPQVSNNVQTGTMNINPMAGPTGIVPGTVVQQQLPLGERQTVGINPVTQSPQVTEKDAFGNVVGVRQAPSGPGVPQLAPGQPQDLPIVAKERAEANAAAAQVPVQRFNNKQIIDILSNSDPTFALTGPGAGALAQVAAAVGVPWRGNRAEDYQNLGHYLALQAQTNAQSMGAGTDAARQLSGLVAGDRQMTPDSLKKIAKVNDAISAGVEKFNQGMEAAIKAAGGNVLAARDFKNAWSKAFDPDVYRYANALEAKDIKEIDAILGKPGTPERAARAKALALKSATLYRLTTQGQ